MIDSAAATDQPMLELNDGCVMPQLGFGTYKIDDDAAPKLVRGAIADGYRLVDTAAAYSNESGVGQGVAGADIFLTTKLWNSEQGEAKARAAVEESLRKLARDSVDLLLIHWPCPDKGLFVETWKTFVALREEGKTRSIGVSNFLPDHLDAIVEATGVVPAVNQIEFHPYFQQPDVVAANRAHGIVTQCWSPLGRGEVFGEAVLRRLAEEHATGVPALVLAWELARGLSTIPKAASERHRKSNLAALELTLSEEDIAAIDALDRGEAGRTGPEPLTFC